MVDNDLAKEKVKINIVIQTISTAGGLVIKTEVPSIEFEA